MARAKKETGAAAAADVVQENSELAALQAKIDGLTSENTALRAENENLRLHIEQLEALKAPSESGQTPSDTRERLMVRTASGRPFWRGGVLFDGEWREVVRAEVGETAWARITAERALQIKETP